jgi:phenylacetate-CoA ligase
MLALLNRHAAQPLRAWKRGSPHLRYLQTLEQSQFDSPEEIRARQLALLQETMQHAWLSVPFYRGSWKSLGLHPENIRSLADLQQFPILTKKDIRAYSEGLRSDLFYEQPTLSKTTTGSTGVPLTIHVDHEAMAWKRAGTLRADQWSGWKLGQRVARLWGHGKIEEGNWKARLGRMLVDRECYLNTLGIDEPRMRSFLEKLRRNPPGLLFGHAHSLYLLACFAQRHYPGEVQPQGIISAAMTLHPWQRSMIEKAFGTPVTNRYGCEEVSLIACECEKHQGLHLFAESVYAEVISDERMGPGARTGKLLVTDLRNRAMPLIRYQIGDVVVGSERTCSCGRGLPLLDEVIGREADYILTPSGTLISGISLTDHFATEIRGAEQVQLIQDRREVLRLRIVASEEFGPDSHRQIDELMARLFGPGMSSEVEVVEAIAPEATGKFRFCISPIANAYIQSLAS